MSSITRSEMANAWSWVLYLDIKYYNHNDIIAFQRPYTIGH